MQFEVVSAGHQFLESPRVDCAGNLYFTDLLAGGVYKRSAAGGVVRFLANRRWIGGLTFTRDGGMVCSGIGGLLYFNETTGKSRPLLTQIEGSPIVAVNDIYADDRGSLYGGTVDFVSIENKAPPAPGVLFRLDPDHRVTVLREGVNVSNGLGLSPDRSRLFHSETSVGVWMYDLDGNRNIVKKTRFATMPDSDGLVVDSQGHIWVAALERGKLLRFRPDGALDDEIALPVEQAVSLTFGGADLCDLYVAAGGDIYDPVQRRAAIYRGRSPVPGQSNPKAHFTSEAP